MLEIDKSLLNRSEGDRNICGQEGRNVVEAGLPFVNVPSKVLGEHMTTELSTELTEILKKFPIYSPLEITDRSNLMFVKIDINNVLLF